ncbi:MAG: hypothetical protein WCL14_13875 [Bacteroidota bacterium]
MSKVTVEENVPDEVKLFKKLKAQIDLDAGTGPLQPLIVEEDVDVDALDALADSAMIHHGKADDYKVSANIAYKEFEKKFDPSWTKIVQAGQVLKSQNPSNISNIEIWGYDVVHGKAINLALTIDEKLILAKKVWDKDATFAPGLSPLTFWKTENHVIGADELTNIADAKSDYELFNNKTTDSETETELRNTDMEDVRIFIIQAGQSLKHTFSDNPRKMEKYGYELTYHISKPKLRTSTLLPLFQMKIKGLVIGKELENTTGGSIKLVKGNDPLGAGIIILAGQKFTLLAGYSTSWIINLSADITAKVSYYYHL